MNVGSGGGAAAAPGGGAAGGPAAEGPADEPKKEEKEEGKPRIHHSIPETYATDQLSTEKEESDEDMGFGLFD